MISLSLLCYIQTIFEDGREIVTSSGLMSKDFTHGWNSSNYIFRVEVDGRLEHQYTFSIDGVPFIQMQRKQDIDRQHRNDRDNDRDSEERNNNNPSRYQKAPFAKNVSGQTSAGARLAGTERRNSHEYADSNPNRGSFQSPEIIKKNSFDPFESTETSDPFGDDPFGTDNDMNSNSNSNNNSNSNSKKSSNNQHTTPTRSAVTVSLLDTMNNDTTPQSNFSYGKNTAPAPFDPFGTSSDPFNTAPAPVPVTRKASDISNDFAGMSFTVTPPVSTYVPPKTDTPQGQVSSDDFFDEEPLPTPQTNTISSPPVWSAPKNLVNLDFNAPPPVSSTNAFSGRSPSLNLLLNGSATRPLVATGMNTATPPKAPMNNNNSPMLPQGQGQGMGQTGQGILPQGQGMGQGMGSRGMVPQGMNNGPQGMQSQGQGMQGGQMGMNGGGGRVMGGGGSGMMQQQPQQQQMYGQQQQQGQQFGMMQGQGQGLGQGQGMMSQQQPMGNGGGNMMGGGNSNGRLMMNNSSGSGMMGQGQGMSQGSGMSQGQGMGQNQGMGQGMGGGQGQGQGQGQGAQFSMGAPVNIPSTSGVSSSLIGSSLARGVPSSNAPKSSLDSINWKM